MRGLEAGKHLQDTVMQTLQENGYHKRSENIKLSNALPLNSKFVQGDYIYLLRGSRKDQMSGFFAYPYSVNKINLNEFCEEHQQHIDRIADFQSTHGQEYFISTTTSLHFASVFAKKNSEFQSIYVLKIPTKYVQRRFPVQHNPFTHTVMEELNEEEYLIPDYILPNEILKEFDGTDFPEIYRYLTQEIGLNITPKDLSLDSDDINKYTPAYIEQRYHETQNLFRQNLDMDGLILNTFLSDSSDEHNLANLLPEQKLSVLADLINSNDIDVLTALYNSLSKFIDSFDSPEGESR